MDYNLPLLSRESSLLLNIVSAGPTSESDSSLDTVRERSASINLEKIPSIFSKKDKMAELTHEIEATQKVIKKNPFYIRLKQKDNTVHAKKPLKASILSLNSTRLHVVNQEEYNQKKIPKSALKFTSRAHAAAVLVPDVINSTAKIGKRIGKSIFYGRTEKEIMRYQKAILIEGNSSSRTRATETDAKKVNAKIFRNIGKALADPALALFQGILFIGDSPRPEHFSKTSFKMKVSKQRSKIEAKLKESCQTLGEMKAIHSIVVKARQLANDFNDQMQHLTSIKSQGEPAYTEFKENMREFIAEIEDFQTEHPNFEQILNYHNLRISFVTSLKRLEGAAYTYYELDRLEKMEASIKEQEQIIHSLNADPRKLTPPEEEELLLQFEINQQVIDSFAKNFPINGEFNMHVLEDLKQLNDNLKAKIKDTIERDLQERIDPTSLSHQEIVQTGNRLSYLFPLKLESAPLKISNSQNLSLSSERFDAIDYALTDKTSRSEGSEGE